MSPEQVEGRRAIDERTDIFSVGVVLYEMLAIAEPFRGKTIDETFDNILHQDPIPPSTRSASRQIPAEVEKVCLKAMQKRPADRYQSMRELVHDLQAAAANIE
jgi:serine/threonine-protein kinase